MFMKINSFSEYKGFDCTYELNQINAITGNGTGLLYQITGKMLILDKYLHGSKLHDLIVNLLLSEAVR